VAHRTFGLGLLAAATTAAVTLVWPGPPPAQAALAPAESPNIVYVVLDDFSSNLLPYMSEVERLAGEAVAFDNFFVTDSQCCPSRASTLTGMYPHNSGVLTNGWRQGGFEQFMERHLDSSLSTQISAAGYRTGYVGKFLNGYRPDGSRGDGDRGQPVHPAGFVPPGWDEWHVAGDGYGQFDYTVAEAIDADVADVVRYGHQEDDYHTDVMTKTAVEFLDRAVGSDGTVDQPFFLTLAPFAVHSRIGKSELKGEPVFPAAPRDRADPTKTPWPNRWGERESSSGDCGEIVGGCDAVVFPDPADADVFNDLPENAPRWMGKKALGIKTVADMRELHLDRIRMAQSINDLLREVRLQLDALDLADSTYIVFTSDNGYHLGEHGLTRGKNSMFDHDIRVPLFVVPPGGVSPRTVSAFSQNTDLLPTFLDLAGSTATGTDGRSLVPLLDGDPTSRWRDAALVEFTRGSVKGDPDRQPHGKTPTYRGVRTLEYIYVDYSLLVDEPSAGQAEFYDLVRDPAATINQFDALSAQQRAALDRALDAYASCAGEACTAAGRSMPDITTRR